MADGKEYPVPTIDHIAVPPTGGRAFVFDDEGYASILPALLMSALVLDPSARTENVGESAS